MCKVIVKLLDPLYRWLTAYMAATGLILYGGKGGSSPPPAPDYSGAAKEQAQSGKENIATQTWGNRPEQVTPWGRTSWNAWQDVDPGTGMPVTRWGQQQTLEPSMQAALDQQIAVQRGRSDLASGQLGRVADEMAQPFDWTGMPAAAGSMSQAQKEAYGRMQEFQRPERELSGEGLEQQMANRGITPGSRAYETERRRLSDQEARQDLQNLQASFGEGRAQGGFQQQLRQQAIAEEAQRRGMSLNELNALLTGQQVSAPQMPGFATTGAAPPLQSLGAAGQQYNAGLDAYNASQMGKQGGMSGLFQLGGAVVGGMFGGPAGAVAGSQIGGAIGGAM